MSLLEVAALLGAVAGILVSLSVIWQKGVKPVFAFITHIREIHEAVQELLPNSGHSIKDDVRITRELLENHINDPHLHPVSIDVRYGRIETESTKEE